MYYHYMHDHGFYINIISITAFLSLFLIVMIFLTCFQHTIPLIITTVECLLIEHTHPSRQVAEISVFGAGLSYTIWSVVIMIAIYAGRL